MENNLWATRTKNCAASCTNNQHNLVPYNHEYKLTQSNNNV